MDRPIYLPTWLFYETSSFFQVDNIKNAPPLRDFLILWSWPHQTESNSARPPPFFKLTTSKTKQFCETSFIFELNNVKNEAILRDFFIFHTWQHRKQSNSATAKHHGPEAHPCTCCCHCPNDAFLKSQETSSKCSSQVSRSEALREPSTKAPGVRFSFNAPPADGRGCE